VRMADTQSKDIDGKSVCIVHKDFSRLLYASLCIPLILLAVYTDTDAVRLECQRPKPYGADHECKFTSYLNADGSWSYANLFSSPSITEEFDLVDLLTSHVLKPEENGKKKNKKGRFGSSHAEKEDLAAKKSSYGVELSLASGMRTFWNDYPTVETAVYQSREIEDFIRKSSSNMKPIKGKFVHEATNLDEILLILSTCALVWFLSLTPFWEKLTVTAGTTSTLLLQQWTLLGSTHHIVYDEVDVDYTVQTSGSSMGLKLRKKLVVPMIGASSSKEAEKEAEEMNTFFKKCHEYSRSQIHRRKKAKELKSRSKDSPTEEKKEPEDDGEVTEADSAPKTSFLQDVWDNTVSYLVPIAVGTPVALHVFGISLPSIN